MPDSAPLSTANGAVPQVTPCSPPARSRRRARSMSPGKRHGDLRVAMREIDLTPSADEPPVRVYDTSGPYSDPAVATDIRTGLPELRRPWILARGDVEEIDGREIRPEDNGLSAARPARCRSSTAPAARCCAPSPARR